MVTRGPGGPFTPQDEVLTAGTELYRVFGNHPSRHAATFNPGFGEPTRFAFFGDPIVPVLYAGSSEIGAIAESLLHDQPISGGVLLPGDYADKVMGRIIVRRDLRLASFMGTGLWALGVKAEDLTTTNASRYGETVAWAEAAHEAGFDGAAWMCRPCNTESSYVLFGDRVQDGDLEIDPGFARAFALPADVDWLTQMCAPLKVQVRR